MRFHLSVEDLNALMEGNVTEREKERIKAHLEECEHCREKYKLLIDLENYLREEDYIDSEFTERVMNTLKKNKNSVGRSRNVSRKYGILKPAFSVILVCIFIGMAFYFGSKYGALRRNAASEPKNQPSVSVTRPPAVADSIPEETDMKAEWITLYFPDPNAEYVVPEYRISTLRKDHETLEHFLFRQLMEGPKEKGKVPVIPEGTRLLSVEVKDGICYLNLSKEFVENNPGGTAFEAVLISSIVNTYTELPYIEKVQFLIEGEKREVYSHVVFDEPFERNESLIKKNENAREETEKEIRRLGTEILAAFRNRDMQKLSVYIHPDKGVRFSPYTYVETEKDVVISREEIKTLFDSDKAIVWGFYDGSGDPIELTFAEYIDRFVYDQDFLETGEAIYDQKTDRGNTINNVFEVYEDCHVLEYYFEGTPEYDGMDWRSLKLVFEEKDGNWYLVGVVHDEWTI